VRLDHKEIESRMHAFIETCRSSGIKITPQRTEIFREAASTDEHPDAETIHRRILKRMPHVSLDTVYRTLHRLEKEGLIQRLHGYSERARFDANTERHLHFVCTKCDRIKDFDCKELHRFQVPDEVLSWGEVCSCHLEVRGVCSECLGRDAPKRACG